MADQKRYLLTSGSLTESELEEIKREAAQDGKPISGLLLDSSQSLPAFVIPRIVNPRRGVTSLASQALPRTR